MNSCKKFIDEKMLEGKKIQKDKKSVEIAIDVKCECMENAFWSDEKEMFVHHSTCIKKDG